MKYLSDCLNKLRLNDALLDGGLTRPLNDRVPDASLSVQCSQDVNHNHRPQKKPGDELKLSYFWQMNWSEARHFDLALQHARSWY